MAYGLPYKHEDSTVAIDLVDAPLLVEQDSSQSPSAWKQERFEMIRILNEKRVEYSKGKKLDLEWLLNRIGSISQPIEGETPEDESLQAALMAQVRQNEYTGMQGKNLGGSKPSRNSKPECADTNSKVIKLILDLKAEFAQSNGPTCHQRRISSYYQQWKGALRNRKAERQVCGNSKKEEQVPTPESTELSCASPKRCFGFPWRTPRANLFPDDGQVKAKNFQLKINECHACWIYPLRQNKCTMQQRAHYGCGTRIQQRLCRSTNVCRREFEGEFILW